MADEPLETAIQELLDAIESGRNASEIDTLIDRLEAVSPMPDVSDLIFIHGVREPKEILEAIRSYKPIAL